MVNSKSRKNGSEAGDESAVRQERGDTERRQN